MFSVTNRPPPLPLPDVGNISQCAQDVRRVNTTSPVVKTFDEYVNNFDKLIIDLQRAGANLPRAYQDAASTPFISYLNSLGGWEFNRMFTGGPASQEEAFLMQIIPDIALAILTSGETDSLTPSSRAFQEVISDLYDGFLSGERRINQQTGRPIKPPDLEILPPLVKWGNPEAGPYTLPIDVTSRLGLKVGVVSLPPAFAQGGLVGWAALGHETAGHDVAHADVGLLDEVRQRIYSAVCRNFGSMSLAHYWAQCTDESLSDVCGCLHMGPAAGIGLIALFRGLMPDGKLRSHGGIDDPHPIDVLRTFLSAGVIAGSYFQGRAAWNEVIASEGIKDIRNLTLVTREGYAVPFPADVNTAIRSAYVVADTIANSKLQSLEGHSLRDIKDWTDADQAITDALGQAIRTGARLPQAYRGDGIFAAHAVAAATLESVKSGANVQTIFNRMIPMLDEMHNGNAQWRQERQTQALAQQERAAAELEMVPWRHMPGIGTISVPLYPQSRPGHYLAPRQPTESARMRSRTLPATFAGTRPYPVSFGTRTGSQVRNPSTRQATRPSTAYA